MREPIRLKLGRILRDWDKLKIVVYDKKLGKKSALLKDVTEERQALCILGWISSYNPVLKRTYELIHFMWTFYGRKNRIEVEDGK